MKRRVNNTSPVQPADLNSVLYGFLNNLAAHLESWFFNHSHGYALVTERPNNVPKEAPMNGSNQLISRREISV
jgi:hypothetical protein